ncbi:MAG TPA: DMT family transporter [Gaiellaceae bacterium]|nr:DMT family transporter [Gaiellaceae bacterium]
MRHRLASTDGILLVTVVIWALNITVTKYILTHGFQPLAYSAVRYGFATAIFLVLTVALERSLRIAGRGQRRHVAAAAFALFLNQVCFVYALKLTTATTVALILGTMPVFAALLSSLAGVETATRRFWLAAGVSFGGVALVAAGSGGDFSGDLAGILIAVGVSATWAAYSVAIAPLMRTYSPFRISAVVLTVMWVPLAALAGPQLADQELDLGWRVWLSFAFAVVGPLVLTNVLWFTAVHRVGPARASLFANLQPFLAALFALLLLSEPLSAWQVAGGALIAAGILLAGRREAVAAPPE